MTAGQRSRFQAVALLVREESVRAQADSSLVVAHRDSLLKRLGGVATILAQTAAREPSLFSLLQEDAEVTDVARRLQLEMQLAAGLDPTADNDVARHVAVTASPAEKMALPRSVVAAQLANPFLAPDFTQAGPKVQGRLVGWELIGPVLNAFEHPSPGASACMGASGAPGDAGAEGHGPHGPSGASAGRCVGGPPDLPPGRRAWLGKTAQALLAAQVAGAFPLLAVVPNVVKTNWRARRSGGRLVGP